MRSKPEKTTISFTSWLFNLALGLLLVLHPAWAPIVGWVYIGLATFTVLVVLLVGIVYIVEKE